MITSAALNQIRGVKHGFFGRKGGHSSGVYASLNTGLGANEDKSTVLANRQIVADALGVERVITPYQYHSNVALCVEKPWDWQEPPKADGLVTKQKNFAIAINTADCTPVIFADAKSGVIGIAHSGWQGTIGGVLEATVAAMVKLGSVPQDITAAIGPTISQENYEVGPEFVERFAQDNADNLKYFKPSINAEHAMFDLAGCVEDKLMALNLGAVENLVKSDQLCTYGKSEAFFSYRRMTHLGESDYGRQMSAICLAS